MKISILKSDKPIGLACDHAGFTTKKYIIDVFEEEGIKYVDFGTCSTDSVDYPDFAHKLGKAIDKGECEYGVAVCGSGNGINMALNKHPKVRAALCWNEEITQLTRLHNDANILVLPGRFVTQQQAYQMTEIFFNTEFEGGRHQDRINKIPC
ncbi:ribose 5-phosphate isomerase B [Dysgonomonas sp. 511]|uniref:ribose 5-phosphate isomerase B n=1 Tax=Dysgonomonas sp. 511 TaxID=2302930 RepID=UPI0013D50B24|nr:ribose 5-phosphate isomerase B [Dysgonomonas sp. 511]NDV78843.1 ribose 5-phosphate isomerase B [Dysgonomonas sp. 511]